MKVVRMILIGSVLSVLYQVNDVVMANDGFVQPYISYQSVTLDISLPLIFDAAESNDFASGFDAEFLLAHQLASGYTMGVKYLDFKAVEELRDDVDHSQLWIGLQFSF